MNTMISENAIIKTKKMTGFAVILAKLGAIVEAFDISSQAIKVGREYARLNRGAAS